MVPLNIAVLTWELRLYIGHNTETKLFTTHDCFTVNFTIFVLTWELVNYGILHVQRLFSFYHPSLYKVGYYGIQYVDWYGEDRRCMVLYTFRDTMSQ